MIMFKVEFYVKDPWIVNSGPQVYYAPTKDIAEALIKREKENNTNYGHCLVYEMKLIIDDRTHK